MVKFAKKPLAGTPKTEAEKPQAAEPGSKEDSGEGPKPTILTGKVAQRALAQEKERSAQLADGSTFRFYVPDGEERRVTFLTGDLGEDGILEVPMWYEHRLQIAGRWREVYCHATEDKQCQACEFELSKDPPRRPQLVAGFWVINHTPYKVKSGPNVGKVIEHQVQPFVTPRTGWQILQNIAAKTGGLAGKTFDASRSDSKSPRTGDQFFQIVNPNQAIVDAYNAVEEVADWDTVIRYISNEDMKKLGIGVGGFGSGDSGGSKELDDEIPF